MRNTAPVLAAQICQHQPAQRRLRLVTAAGTFLNSHLFNGGSHTRQLGLRLVW